MDNHDILRKIRQVSQAFLSSDKGTEVLQQGLLSITEQGGCFALLYDPEGLLLAASPGQGEDSLEELAAAGQAAENLKTFMDVKEPLVNKEFPTGASRPGRKKTAAKKALYNVFPIAGRDGVIARLLVSRGSLALEIEQLILAEVGAALTGIILEQRSLEREEEEARNRDLAEVAFESLSYSEVEAIREILKNIDNNESVVVASKIADRLGITRSVIVNALRKFESAGIIESRSLGMKGTFIRVKNYHALEIIADRSAKLGTIG